MKVSTTYPLVGENWYVSKIDVQNTSEKTIKITKIELVSQEGIYLNQSVSANSYPLTLPKNKTESLDVSFRLDRTVYKEFYKQPAEVRVHYSQDGGDGIVRAGIVGKDL